MIKWYLSVLNKFSYVANSHSWKKNNNSPMMIWSGKGRCTITSDWEITDHSPFISIPSQIKHILMVWLCRKMMVDKMNLNNDLYEYNYLLTCSLLREHAEYKMWTRSTFSLLRLQTEHVEHKLWISFTLSLSFIFSVLERAAHLSRPKPSFQRAYQISQQTRSIKIFVKSAHSYG